MNESNESLDPIFESAASTAAPVLQPSGMTHEHTPREIVVALDQHIIGQNNAKRAVAIALRNRWRRMQLDEVMRKEITPKNILMMGPTGVGKTEIARRLAVLANAPFIKVEATKFTEVGYVGRDVESIVRDLMDIGVKMTREQEMIKIRPLAGESAENRILDALLPPARGGFEGERESASEKTGEASATRQLFRKKLRAGELDDKEIEIEVAAAGVGVEIMAPPGMEEMTSQLQSMFENISGNRTKRMRMKVKNALKQVREEEAAKMLNEEEVRSHALEMVEQHGIVFIDEFDKIVRRGEYVGGSDVSREGVQRDLLPLVEGSTVSTKYGMVKTDHILFIASGAFQLTRPSDLIPELQGRFPIRVELDPLTTADFVRILTEPAASLTRQYAALMQTEGVVIEYTDDGIDRIADVAFQVNQRMENIGARRLYTVMEKLFEIISYEAGDKEAALANAVLIDKAYVDKQLAKLLKDEDLSHYIL